jgi:hypothetical protein
MSYCSHCDDDGWALQSVIARRGRFLSLEGIPEVLRGGVLKSS